MSLPRVGETRCYWVLLDAALNFVYLDPVLAYHLDSQAGALITHTLLEFVHPDEQSSAKTDLGSVLDSRTLHGSVTRVRYSRLSRIRRMLGHAGPADEWEDAEKISVDANYMAVDIVINWAAEGLVLCFIHAVVDLDPKSDNDEKRKTGWTNWCGTAAMSGEQISLLYHQLMRFIHPPGSGMTRVFQILANQQERALLLSWPPDQNQGATGRDFAGLVEQVQIGTGIHSGNDAKTSCTRRYKATQDMPPNIGGQVESIFIPHGAIIFACHKVTPRPPLPSIAYPENYSAYPTHYYPQQQTWPPPPTSDMPYPPWDEYAQPTLPRPTTPSSYPASEAGGSPSDVVPPSRRRVSSESSNAPKESNRQGSNRPTGINMCSSCKATTSPEWRKGPSGKKELCNACGLRYARSRAKKDGQNQTQRKKKEKNVLAAAAAAARRESITPPTSSSSSASYRRDDSVYSPLSPNDFYRSHHTNDTSPSPSPSTYSSYSDNRSFAPIPHHHSFYSGPSPLSNPPVTDLPSSYERGSSLRDGR